MTEEECLQCLPMSRIGVTRGPSAPPADRRLFRKVSNLTLWIPPVMRRVRKAGLCTEGQGAAGSSGSSVHPLLILPSQLLNIIGGWS